MRLNRVLDDTGFNAFVEAQCAPFYADGVGRPSLAPGRYFRLLLLGYFEGLDSERAIVTLTWEELEVLPTRWKVAMSEWSGVYYIFDVSDTVGYARSFRFSILERVSPDMSEGDVIRLEATWKDRLHTRAPRTAGDH